MGKECATIVCYCVSPPRLCCGMTLSLIVCSIDKSKALSLILHCADISHPAKDWKLHYRWTEMLLEEFFKQVCLAPPPPPSSSSSSSFRSG